MCVEADGDPEWLLDPEHAERLREDLVRLVADHAVTHPLETGPAVEAARHRLRLPDAALVGELVTPPLELRAGRVVDTRRGVRLPDTVVRALATLAAELAEHPWLAPDAHRLRDLGLGTRELAAAVRAGALVKVADGVYLEPSAVERADEPLRALDQPFTLSAARQAWGTSRRVAVPLLELLDREGRTRRQPDDRRTITRDDAHR
jgi:selenocysteine-specific elongation factor